jgi:lipoprotein-releasing system permease protein
VGGGRRARWLAALLALAGGGALLAAHLLEPHEIDTLLKGRRYDLFLLTQNLARALVATAAVVGFFSLLVSRFSIFTSISVFGVFIGTGALVVVLSVMSGLEGDLRDKMLGQQPHLTVRRPKQRLAGYAPLQRAVGATPGVVDAEPYVESEVMLASETNLAGVILRGIEIAPGALARSTLGTAATLRRSVRQGSLDGLVDPKRIPPPAAPTRAARPNTVGEPVPGVLIGRELATNLRLFVGDEVSVICPACGIGPMGSMPKVKPLRVAGIFYSGMYEYDSKNIYVTLEVAQRFLGYDDEVSGVEARVARPARIANVAALARQALGPLDTLARGGGPALEVRTWEDDNRELLSALTIEKIAMFVVLTFIILVASFSIVSNLMMIVIDKRREIAILKAMGTPNGGILKVFLLEGFYIGAIGTLSGIVAGLMACALIARLGIPLDPEVYYISKLPVRVAPLEVVLVAGASLLLSVLATLQPAWSAARIEPVEGLRAQ